MSFKEMKFKGKRVFVEVDETGSAVIEDGRARMKYKLETDRIYSPNPANIKEIDGTDLALPPPAKKKKRKSNRRDVVHQQPSDTGARELPPETTPVPAASESPPPVMTQFGKDARIVAYTDGSCSHNPGPAGIGYVVTFPDGLCIKRGEPIGSGTNNIAELTAIQKVLELVGDSSCHLMIHTDSEYSIGVLTRGWKAKANQQLIFEIKKALSRFDNVELIKVKGHAGVPENELVDQLARTAAETQSPVS